MKTILWDFDRVILDSMNVRDFGFKEIFKHYEIDEAFVIHNLEDIVRIQKCLVNHKMV